MAHVAASERLRIPDEQGRTRYSVLAAFEKSTGKRHPEMDVPKVRPALQYLVGWFHQIADRRQSGINGPLPISHQEIDAWARLYGRRLSAEEVAALVKMDDACLAVYAKAREKPTPKKGKK